MSEPVFTTSVQQTQRLNRNRAIITVIAMLLMLIVSSLSVVKTGYAAVIVWLMNDQARVLSTPGVHFRIPFLEKTWLIDTRLKTTALESLQTYATADKQTIRLSGGMIWHVTDPAQFHKATTANPDALDESLRMALASALSAWAATQPAAAMLKATNGEISQDALASLNQRLGALGISAVRVALQCVSPSDGETKALITRMSDVRTRYARQLIEELAADQKRLLETQGRQQANVLDAAYRTAQQTRQAAEQQLLAAYARQYGTSKGFADALTTPQAAGTPDHLPAGERP